MIYQYKGESVNLSSSWTCALKMVNGSYEWSIASTPTEGAYTQTYPVELPSNAIVKSAWMEITFGSPLSGAAYKRVNGVSVSDGKVDVDGIGADTTEFSATFTFRANGVIYPTYDTHTASLSGTDPTLYVEYVTAGSPEEDGTEDGTGDDGTSDNNPDGGGLQLPRLLDAAFAEIARVEPDRMDLELQLHPLSTAYMHLPKGQPEVKPRDFFELFSPIGSVGLYRVTEVSTSYGPAGGQDVYLEHALTTLADSLALGTQAMSGTVAVVFATLLEAQADPYWALGDCEVPEDYELVYEYTYDNLLRTVTKLLNMLPEEYVLETDTHHRPFLMHIRALTDEDACECRLNRNLSSAKLTVDTSSLCTQIYPFGAGEGTDRVTLTSLNGMQYLDADTVGTWGVVAKTFTDDEIFDALMLNDAAARYLNKYKDPTVSVRLDALDLYAATGEPFDRFRLGRMCRLPLPAYGVTMRERVISVTYPDVYGAPQRATVTLANKIRDATDEIAELMRQATQSKLLGGWVETVEEKGNNDSVTPGTPFVQYFTVSGYGNLLSVRTAYTCVNDLTLEKAYCHVAVDGNEVPDSIAETGTFDILRYLAGDENGVPTVGSHKVRFEPRGVDEYYVVTNTLTIKTIEKR